MLAPVVALVEGQPELSVRISVMQLLFRDTHFVENDVVVAINVDAIPAAIDTTPNSVVAYFSFALQLIKLRDFSVQRAAVAEESGSDSDDDGDASNR